MTPVLLQRTILALFWCCSGLFLFASELHAGKIPSIATPQAEPRFSATRPFTQEISEENAMLVAETAARLNALQSFIRNIIVLPEVRIAGSIGPMPTQTPNLLALAHATAQTSVLLHSKSRKSATVTVTIVLHDIGPEMETKVRDALLNPDRLALHEKIVLREKAILDAFDAHLSLSAGNKDTRHQSSEEMILPLINELKALRIFTRQLPLYSGLWENPTAVREAMQEALALAPQSALCRNAMGDASLQLGRSQDALEEQTLAIKAEPDFARAFHSRGTAAMALGHLSSAVADFSEAIRLSPQTGGYYKARGMAQHLRGETQAMCRDLVYACTLGECGEFQWAVSNNFCES